MAPWCDAKLFFCLLFISCCCTVTVGQIAMDCCLEVSETPIERQWVKDYQHQISGQGCSIDAIVFETRKGKRLCAPVNQTWVENLKDHVHQLKTHCKKRNYKGNRCKGLKPK